MAQEMIGFSDVLDQKAFEAHKKKLMKELVSSDEEFSDDDGGKKSRKKRKKTKGKTAEEDAGSSDVEGISEDEASVAEKSAGEVEPSDDQDMPTSDGDTSHDEQSSFEDKLGESDQDEEVEEPVAAPLRTIDKMKADRWFSQDLFQGHELSESELPAIPLCEKKMNKLKRKAKAEKEEAIKAKRKKKGIQDELEQEDDNSKFSLSHFIPHFQHLLRPFQLKSR